jgi:hypothetical protein
MGTDIQNLLDFFSVSVFKRENQVDILEAEWVLSFIL